MKTWVLGFGPDTEEVIRQCKVKAEELGAKVIVVQDPGNIQAEDLKPNTAQILAFDAEEYEVVVLSEEKYPRIKLTFGGESDYAKGIINIHPDGSVFREIVIDVDLYFPGLKAKRLPTSNFKNL